jgi:hypothetical protein
MQRVGTIVNDREKQIAVLEIVQEIIQETRKEKGYRDAAVFQQPQMNNKPANFLVSFRAGRFDDQDLQDMSYLIAGLDLTIDMEFQGVTEDRQRLMLKYNPRPQYKKSTPPQRTKY